MKLSNETARDLIAGEYALGSLTARARKRFERMMREDADLRSRVLFWEEQLQGLAGRVAIEPPASVWPAVQRRLGWQESRRGSPGWLAVMASAVLVAVTLAYWQPWRDPYAQARQLELASAEGEAVWELALDAARQRLRVRALRRPFVPGSKDLELWLLRPNDAAPVSLGLMPEREGEVLVLQAAIDLNSGIGIAVSVEPAGGSPTGAPTGPVKYLQLFSS